MSSEKVKAMGMKLMERKFAVPGSASILALANDAAHLGFDFKTIIAVLSASILYSAIEAWVDIARIRKSI